MKHAQIALEFIMYTIVAVFIVISLLALGLNLSVDKMKEQRFDDMNALADSLQEEILLASQMGFGYHRAISLPSQIRGGSYSISNSNSFFWISDAEVNISREIPPITGTFMKGDNIISNQGGVLVEQ